MYNVSYKNLFLPLISVLLLLPLLFMPSGNLNGVIDYIKFTVSDKTGYKITLSPVNQRITALSSDPENELIMMVEIRDKDGNVVPGAKIIMNARTDKKAFPQKDRFTDKSGSCLITYKPQILPASAYIDGKAQETVTVAISGTKTEASLNFNLTHIPVIFIHGYQANSSLFDNFKDYLGTKGFPTEYFNYDSTKGVAYGARQLDSYISNIKDEYIQKGIQINRVDLIGHSMGGLVARYYTCSPDYTGTSTVEKIIFLSVPQNGSSLATLGLKYYNDKGILDLMPDSSLFTEIFPNMKNKGLNNMIQTGSLLGQYDEVVSPESASLDEWGIKNELFNVGDNNFTVDKLLSGKIVEAANHKMILYNKKVFERVEEMLENPLAYPIINK